MSATHWAHADARLEDDDRRVQRFQSQLRHELEMRHGWRDRPDHARTCRTCGRAFDIAASERAFAEAAGVPLPALCRRCRPTRRELRSSADTLHGGR